MPSRARCTEVRLWEDSNNAVSFFLENIDSLALSNYIIEKSKFFIELIFYGGIGD